MTNSNELRTLSDYTPRVSASWSDQRELTHRRMDYLEKSFERTRLLKHIMP